VITRRSDPSPFWRWAPATRAGLVISVLGIAALAVAGQFADVRAPADAPSRALTSAVAVIGVLVVAYVARLVPLGSTYLRRDVGARFAGVVYGLALAAALIAVLVGEAWLTAACTAVLVVLAVLVMTHEPRPGTGSG
jgi:uncharacterized membrane protein YhaH (DUF805 family)